MKKLLSWLLVLAMVMAIAPAAFAADAEEDLTWGLTPFDERQTLRITSSPALRSPIRSCSRISWACSTR